MTHPRILILPDLHNRIATHQAIIDQEQADRVLHLGDYWDDWGDGPHHARLTAEWVRERIRFGDILLLGNHDIWYLYKYQHHRCPGNDWRKENAIDTTLTHKDTQAFLLFYWLRSDLLATHAGLAGPWVPQGTTKRNMHGVVEEQLSEAETRVKYGDTHPLIHCCSQVRGGWHKVPGVLWQSWEEFAPVPGLSQIVGHTPAAEPRILRAFGGTNYCIDTHSRHYAVLEEDGKIYVRSVLEDVVLS